MATHVDTSAIVLPVTPIDISLKSAGVGHVLTVNNSIPSVLRSFKPVQSRNPPFWQNDVDEGLLMPNEFTRQDEAGGGVMLWSDGGTLFSSSCLALLTLYNLLLTQLCFSQLSILIYLLAVYLLIHLSHRLVILSYH